MKPREVGVLGEKTGSGASGRALAKEVLNKTNFCETRGNVKAPGAQHRREANNREYPGALVKVLEVLHKSNNDQIKER